MSHSTDNPSYDFAAFDRAVDPVLRMLTPADAKRLVQYRGDEALQDRIEELAAKCNEGELTAAERAEYEAYVRANKFVAILQTRLRKILADRPKR